MPRIQNHLSHIWYYNLMFINVIWLFFYFIIYPTLSLKLIAHFVDMHVGMDQGTIVETQTTIDLLNKVI
jgi:ABC-type antimicrobial peptide transport system ATPase subunit